MSLATPVALNTNSFDATQSHECTFVATGGNQVVANRITVANAETNVIVYQNKINSYQYSQTIPSGTLTNGIRYYFYFNTYDLHDNVSSDSNKIYFYCYGNATIVFNNIPASGTINSASYTFSATWNQPQGETLQSFQFFLYDKTRTLVDSSEKLTSTNIPPIVFTHTFDGFSDDTIYYVSATATSTNGISTSTELYAININNAFSGDYFLIKATNHCNDGYNEIVNNVHEIDGTTDGEFIDDEHLLLNEWGETAVWSSGLQFFNDAFVCILWWKPVMLGKIARLESADGRTWFDITFKRGIPNQGDVHAKDYILIEGYYNGYKYVSKMSNKIVQINNNTDVILYFKVVGNDITAHFERRDATGTILNWNTHYYAWNKYADGVNYFTAKINPEVDDTIFSLASHAFIDYETVRSYDAETNTVTDNTNSNYIRNPNGDNSQDGESDVIYGITSGIYWEDEVDATEENEIIWNESSNVEYNRITDMWYQAESEGGLITDSDWKQNDYDTTYITKITLENCIVDALYITHNTAYGFPNAKPTWDNATVMYCEFQGNLLAGNVDWVTSNITSVKIKRRLSGTQKWLTLYEKPIYTVDDLSIEYVDYLCPSGYVFDYALVPCTANTEWDYSITSVYCHYDGLFVIDSKGNCKKLYGGVMYNNDTNVNSIATLQPYNMQYPVIIRNPYNNYRSLSVSGYILNPDDYSKLMDLASRIKINEEQDKWIDFFNTGRSVIVKDWNGKIFLMQSSTAPSFTYLQSTGNGVPYMTVGVSEIGKYNDATDLYNNGFIDVEG